MHLSQLLACVLLLMLLSLGPSESKPAAAPKVQRTPQGEELAVSQAEGGSQKKRDKTPGGGGAHPKGDQSRLFRDLRVETKARVAWARHLQENPNARKNKGNKKGPNKGCFGLKLDRIGSTSGLGC
ncbi:C-type natriuretic peptide [Rousettus aegyptiacus]|uniref:C-type natriuretic peptide n=1 Tax=Rousettus aegyptiacus TaxID=9407 RepID=A0A7J8JJV8_ROUAE|nr:C-type natriuretic peptide [Rousettus aegyptiacus]XP_015990097.1 C-type natriuretic peptide [Rousettus aegyptiacus]KAF6496740.1 natriuretic peptide C [Rousettus aegyptiacus]